MINFGADKALQGSILVPLYSTTKPVVKVFDNLFFDTTNGNLVEVFGPAVDSVSADDATKTTPSPDGVFVPAATMMEMITRTKLEENKKLLKDPASSPNWVRMQKDPEYLARWTKSLKDQIRESKQRFKTMFGVKPSTITASSAPVWVTKERIVKVLTKSNGPNLAWVKMKKIASGDTTAAPEWIKKDSPENLQRYAAAIKGEFDRMTHFLTKTYGIDPNTIEITAADEAAADAENAEEAKAASIKAQNLRNAEEARYKAAMDTEATPYKAEDTTTDNAEDTTTDTTTDNAEDTTTDTTTDNAEDTTTDTTTDNAEETTTTDKADKAKVDAAKAAAAKITSGLKRKLFGFESMTTTSSSDITGITVITRANAQSHYDHPTGDNAVVSCRESELRMTSNRNKFSYATRKDGGTTDSYFVCYAAWGTDTYLHVINTTTNTAVCSQRFTATVGDTNHILVYTNSVIPALASTPGMPIESNGGVAAPTNIKTYSKPVYQVSSTPTGHFDAANGYLVLVDPGASQAALYDRYGNTVAFSGTVATSVPPAAAFIAWSVVQAGDMYVYMAFGYDTVILLIRNTGSITKPQYTLAKVALFNQTGAAAKNADDDADSTDRRRTRRRTAEEAEIVPLLTTWLRQQLQPDGGAVSAAKTSDAAATAATAIPATAATANTVTTTTGGTVNLDDYTLKTMIVPTIAAPAPPTTASGGGGGGGDASGGAAASGSGGVAASGDATITTTAASGGAAVASGGGGDASGSASGEVAAVSKKQSAMPSAAASTVGGSSGFTVKENARRAAVQGIDTRSAFGAMIHNPSKFRPTPASMSLF